MYKLIIIVLILFIPAFSNLKLDNAYQTKYSSNPDNSIPNKQIIFVTTKNSQSFNGILYGMEFIDNMWVVTFDTINCTIGRNGFAEYGDKREGDLKTPSGSFRIGSAFGYKNDLNCKFNFIELTDSHCWVDDVSSEHYNKLIEFTPENISYEKMKRKDHLYKYGIIVEYNTEPIIPGKGSAIFIHLERKEGDPTLGCIAISLEEIKKLILWLNPDKNPMIKMGVNL